MVKSEPQQLGRNDAANGPNQYRTKPKLGDPTEPGFETLGVVVKPETSGKFSSRTGQNDRTV